MSTSLIPVSSVFSVDSRYKVVKILGKGSYGVVCSAIDTQSSTINEVEMQIAIKKVNNIFKRDILLKRALRELKLMRFFNGHKNVVSLINLEIKTDPPNEGLYCFQELAEYDLARVIYSSTQLSEYHIQSFIYQILCGLKYIHSGQVIHRDLKPGNILVSIQGTLKICDFGLARGIDKSQCSKGNLAITNYVATRWYRAPELLFGCKEYDKAIDIWAVGCILAELYGRKPIFMGESQVDQIQQILKILGSPPATTAISNSWNLDLLSKQKHQPKDVGSLYPLANYKATDLLQRQLQWDPKSRPSASACLEHSFFVPVRVEEDEVECERPFNFSFEDMSQATADPLQELQTLLHLEVEDFQKERRV